MDRNRLLDRAVDEIIQVREAEVLADGISRLNHPIAVIGAVVTLADRRGIDGVVFKFSTDCLTECCFVWQDTILSTQRGLQVYP